MTVNALDLLYRTDRAYHREQARGIPEVLCADQETHDVQDITAVEYDDGQRHDFLENVNVAPPFAGTDSELSFEESTHDSAQVKDLDLQMRQSISDVARDSILKHYANLRTKLRGLEGAASQVDKDIRKKTNDLTAALPDVSRRVPKKLLRSIFCHKVPRIDDIVRLQTWQALKILPELGSALISIISDFDDHTVEKKLSAILDQTHRLGIWIFAILARIDDLGTLSTEEVGSLRDLGKLAIQAAAAGKRFNYYQLDSSPEPTRVQYSQDGMSPNSLPVTANTGLLETQSISEDIDRAKADLLELVGIEVDLHVDGHESGLHKLDGDSTLDDVLLDSSEPVHSDSQQQVTPLAISAGGALVQDHLEVGFSEVTCLLDTIICILGIEYGQRDLLEARKWFWSLNH